MHRHRILRLLAAVLAGLFSVIGLLAAPGHASVKPTPSQKAVAQKKAQPKIVKTTKPLSVKNALNIPHDAGAQVYDLHFDGNGIVGGYVPDRHVSTDAQAEEATQAIQRRFGRTPVVSAITLAPGTSSSILKQIRAEVSDAPAAPADSRSSAFAPATPLQHLKKSAAPQVTAAPVSAPSEDPDVWSGIAWNQGGNADIDYQFQWQSADSHSPTDIPDDWGFETGFTLYNSGLTGIRPICLGGNADTDFWATSWDDGGTWATNVPDAAAPYADWDIDTDSCSNNELGVGIGYPQQLSSDTGYEFFVEKNRGTVSTSPFDAQGQIVSNDCNNLGLSPDSSCMGLNTARDPGNGEEPGVTYIHEDRGWTLPGCTFAENGSSEEYISNGEADCTANQ